MGYRRKPKTFVLEFAEDSEFHGLEVRARGTSVGGLLGMMDLARLGEDRRMTPDAIKDVSGMFRTFAGKIESWNLEDENGNPVSLEPIEVPVPDSRDLSATRRETPTEAKYRVLMEQDMDMVMSLVLAWLDGMVGTPGPLDKTSNAGGQSEEVSIPMDALSSAPPS